MTNKRKPPRRGGSTTLPKGASLDDIDDALRSVPKKAKHKKQSSKEKN